MKNASMIFVVIFLSSILVSCTPQSTSLPTQVPTLTAYSQTWTLTLTPSSIPVTATTMTPTPTATVRPSPTPIATPTRNLTDTRILKDISIQEAADLIKNNKNNPNFVILDVRTPVEFKEGYIESAINLDFYSTAFKDELDKLDKGRIYFIYCRTGNRSGQAMQIMESLNFRCVYNLSGGIVAWVSAGLPVVK